MQGHLPHARRDVRDARRQRRGAVRGARVQDRDRSVRREADVLPRVLGRAEGRLVRLQLDARTSASASARLLQMHANKREEIEEVRAGDIAAAIGLKDTRTGDTLCDDEKPIILEAMKFPNPVIDVAIEPKTKADQDKLGIALGKLAEEDPTFRVHSDPETGQTIISGHGRAAPRDHRRPHDARVQGRRERRPSAGRVPRDDPQARRQGRGEVHPPVGRQGTVRPRRHQRRAGGAGARASCSRTRSSAA